MMDSLISKEMSKPRQVTRDTVLRMAYHDLVETAQPAPTLSAKFSALPSSLKGADEQDDVTTTDTTTTTTDTNANINANTGTSDTVPHTTSHPKLDAREKTVSPTTLRAGAACSNDSTTSMPTPSKASLPIDSTCTSTDVVSCSTFEHGFAVRCAFPFPADVCPFFILVFAASVGANICSVFQLCCIVCASNPDVVLILLLLNNTTPHCKESFIR